MAEETEKTKLEQERDELDKLIGKGVTFEVEDVRFRVEKRFFGLLKKRIPETYKRKFSIQEPTLGTLDRLSREWVEFEFDNERLKSAEGMKAARTMAAKHAIRCAKVVALAVLGSDILIAKPGKHGVVRYVEDANALKELTNLFARTIKPSLLHRLVVLIGAMCNLGDFCNSIRLMQTERTTTPIRIEDNGV
jgi:hypothetical protein